MTNKLQASILYCEDEAELRQYVQKFLELHCEHIFVAADGREALEMAREQRPDLVLTDIRMPKLDGLMLAEQLEMEMPAVPVVLMTAFSKPQYLVRAIEIGVSGFVRKPIDFDELLKTVRKVLQPTLLRREMEKLHLVTLNYTNIYLGESPTMRRIADQAMLAASSLHEILIVGEQGTGKTRLASLIHTLGGRRKKPFITVNCDGVPAERLEIELFGKKRWGVGRLGAAEGGSLLLQRIDCAPLQVQSRLLRLLEDRYYYPIGDTVECSLQCRIMATAGAVPASRAQESRLVDELMYRLAVQSIRLAALRDMPEEIPVLAQRLLLDFADSMNIQAPSLTSEALRVLQGYLWPGNIRELKSALQRLLFISANRIGAADIQSCIESSKNVGSETSCATYSGVLSLDSLEKWAIAEALRRSGGRKMQAARMLGIDYKRFKRKAALHGVSV
ncbi:MAG: sigma-54 dependent transcriptional regulator [Desulfobulbus sp.]|nr:sigma-54 dependent transcriptional regulator [Desulfobulbus sp.]